MKKLAWAFATAGLMLAATVGIGAAMSGDFTFVRTVLAQLEPPANRTADAARGRVAGPTPAAPAPLAAREPIRPVLDPAAQSEPALPQDQAQAQAQAQVQAQSAPAQPAAQPSATAAHPDAAPTPGWTVLVVRGMQQQRVTFDDPYEKRPVLIGAGQ